MISSGLPAATATAARVRMCNSPIRGSAASVLTSDPAGPQSPWGKGPGRPGLPDHAASAPDFFATWVAIASISGGDRQS